MPELHSFQPTHAQSKGRLKSDCGSVTKRFVLGIELGETLPVAAFGDDAASIEVAVGIAEDNEPFERCYRNRLESHKTIVRIRKSLWKTLPLSPKSEPNIKRPPRRASK